MSGDAPPAPWVTALLALIAYMIFRFLSAADFNAFAIWMFGGLAAYCGLATLVGLYRIFDGERLERFLKRPSGLHGRLDFPTAEDAEKLGLKFSNPDGNGIPVGGVADKIIYADITGHGSIRSPTGGGKTESFSALICFALGGHRNIISTAKGAELAYLCGPYRKDVLGQQVFYVDPWRQMQALGLPSHDFNPIGHLVRYAEQRSPELLSKARESVSILLPLPEGGGGDNRIFTTQAQSWLSDAVAYAAICEADTGELCANLPYLFKVLCGSNDDLQSFLLDMRRCDLYEGSFRRAADRILGKMQRAAKTAESILTTVQDALQIFDPAGPLGKNTEFSDFDASDLKNPEKPTSVFIVIPPEKSTTYGSFAGLCLNSLIDTCIEADRFEPRVTVVADEFANIAGEGKLPAILPTLYVGRSRGVQLITFVQEVDSYSRYGAEASAFTSQSEILVAWNIKNTKDAKEYSERSGLRSVVGEQVSTSLRDADGKYSISLSEQSVPYIRPDEFMQLPDFTGVLFFRQHPPLKIDLVSYRAVEPWRSYAKPMPGAPPLKDIPVKYRA